MAHSDHNHSVSELLAHTGWLRRLAANLVGAQHADDLVQDTWLSALQGNPPAGRGLRPWLARVLQNRSIDWLRVKERRSRREELVAREEALPGSDFLAERAETFRILVSEVQGLSPIQRDVILLRFFDELAPAQIAELLGMPSATVRSHLRRGLEQLRVRLDDNQGRTKWTTALALWIPSSASQGLSSTGKLLPILLMKTSSKIVLLACSALVVGVIWHNQTGATLPTDLHSTGAATAVQVPLVERTSQSKQTSEVSSPEPSSRTVQPAVLSIPMAGTVVDAETGDPMEFYALGLMHGAPPSGDPPPFSIQAPPGYERVVTDAGGRFLSLETYVAGDYHALLLEDWDRLAVTNRFGLGFQMPREPLTFSYSPNKAVRLQVKGECGFRIDCLQAQSIGIHTFVAQRTQNPEPARGGSTWTSVLGGPQPFVRFPPMVSGNTRPSQLWLHMASQDGTLIGTARIPACQSIGDAAISITLQACGRIDLEVTADVPPFTDRIMFRSFPGEATLEEMKTNEPAWASGFDTRKRSVVSSTSKQALLFHRDYEPLGLQTVLVSSAGFADHVQVLEVRPGFNPAIPITLQRQETANGRIEGLVRVGSAKPPKHEVIVQVTETGNLDSFRTAKVVWQEEQGAWIGRFAMEDLYDREYRVLLTPGMSVPRKGLNWRPKPRDYRVRPNGPPLQYRLGPPPNKAVYEVRVLDAKTGQPLPSFHVLAFVEMEGEGEQDPVKGTEGLATLNLPGLAHQVRLLAFAPGYAPGQLESIAAPGERGVSKSLIRLERGWGGLVRVLLPGDKSGTHLGDVRVLVDGIDMGHTDADGVLWLALPERPSQIEVAKQGFEVSKSHGPITASGSLTDPQRGAPMDGFFFVLQPKQ